MPTIRHAASWTGKFCLKTIWYTTITLTCPLWCPIIPTCYAWDLLHNGRPNSPKRRHRMTQRHKRNRKVRARPLLLPPNAIDAAAKTCALPATAPQTQSPLFAKLPPEVRDLIWDHVFQDVDVHARLNTPTSIWDPAWALEEQQKIAWDLLLWPCLDHAYLSHPRTAGELLCEHNDPPGRGSYDLPCWPKSRADARLAWPNDKAARESVKRLGNVLAVTRTARVVQLEALQALARTVNVISTWHWPHPSGLETRLSRYLPFTNQTTVTRLLQTRDRYQWGAQAAPDTGMMYGPLISGCRRLKLVVVDCRLRVWRGMDLPGDAMALRNGVGFGKALEETVRGLREHVEEVEVLVLDGDEGLLGGLKVPGGCTIRAVGRSVADGP